MSKFLIAILTSAVILPISASTEELVRIFLLHNSVGQGLIEQGELRELLAEHNTEHQTVFRFWDHHYPYIGLSDAEGNLLGYPYSSVCGHNTNPDGLHLLWLNDTIPQYTSARDSIMANHQVIAFKSCYRAVDFGMAQSIEELHDALELYKSYYIEMRSFFDQHPEKIFVVISPPPRHRLHANSSIEQAAHARLFANWLKSTEYLGDPPRHHLRAFDLFDLLAAPDDGQPAANMLRYEYELSHNNPDSHPNALANATIAPYLAEFLIEAATGTTPIQSTNMTEIKNLFRE